MLTNPQKFSVPGTALPAQGPTIEQQAMSSLMASLQARQAREDKIKADNMKAFQALAQQGQFHPNPNGQHNFGGIQGDFESKSEGLPTYSNLENQLDYTAKTGSGYLPPAYWLSKASNAIDQQFEGNMGLYYRQQLEDYVLEKAKKERRKLTPEEMQEEMDKEIARRKAEKARTNQLAYDYLRNNNKAKSADVGKKKPEFKHNQTWKHPKHGLLYWDALEGNWSTTKLPE